MEQIGARLLREGLIDVEQLEDALQRQRVHGGYLGHHLIDAGHVERTAFYDTLAALWQLSRRDLLAEPPDPAVLDEVDLDEGPAEGLGRGWVPCELTAGEVVVATSVQPAPEIVAEVEETYPRRSIRFVACTRRDLDAVVLAHRARVLEPLAAPLPGPLVRPVHHVIVALAGLAGFGAITVLPLDVVAGMVVGAAALFLTGVSVQATLGLAAFSRELAEEAGGHAVRRPSAVRDREEDHLLPTYSVLVRIRDARDVADALGLLGSLDYPHSRLDAVILVREDDAVSLDALAGAAPPEWVRIGRVPVGAWSSGVDRSRTYDHGLALARGRYVVIYRPDERPDPGQLRRAVADFEADELRRRADRGTLPLFALRAARLVDPARRSPYARLATVDDGLRIGRVSSEVPAGAVPRDLGSTHFSMRQLRRLGGLRVVHPALESLLPGVERPRIEVLDSTSVVGRVPGALVWTHERAQASAATVRVSLGRLRAAVASNPVDRATATHAVLALSLPMMFLSLPLLLQCALVVALRSGMEPGTFAERAVWLGLGEAVMAMCGVAAYVGMVLARRHGVRAVIDLVVLPFHWCLASAAMWAAVLALGVRHLESRRPADEVGPSLQSPGVGASSGARAVPAPR